MPRGGTVFGIEVRVGVLNNAIFIEKSFVIERLYTFVIVVCSGALAWFVGLSLFIVIPPMHKME
jgi:hypothetical protein